MIRSKVKHDQPAPPFFFFTRWPFYCNYVGRLLPMGVFWNLNTTYKNWTNEMTSGNFSRVALTIRLSVVPLSVWPWKITVTETYCYYLLSRFLKRKKNINIDKYLNSAHSIRQGIIEILFLFGHCLVCSLGNMSTDPLQDGIRIPKCFGWGGARTEML